MNLALWLPLIFVLTGQTPPAGREKPADPSRADRLRPLQAIFDGTSLEIVSSTGRDKVEPIANPIYTYEDPTRQYLDGAIWTWTQSGRPVALMTLTTRKEPGGEYDRKCEMTSLAPGPLSASMPLGWNWEPDQPGVIPLPIPKAPAPAGDESKRLRQMKEQARRFRAFEFFPPTNQAAAERYELRLLPQPVLRFAAPKSGLIDGSIFFMVYGTNPEVAILIEASHEGTSTLAWTYGLARLAGAELHVTLDEGEVWKQMRYTSPSIRNPYTNFRKRIVLDP